MFLVLALTQPNASEAPGSLAPEAQHLTILLKTVKLLHVKNTIFSLS